MKKYLPFFIGVLLLSLTTANSQYVTIPDSAFRSQLSIKYPGCFNGAGQMDTTCAAIINETSLGFSSFAGGVSIYAAFIQNINGIQYFKNLQSLAMADLQISKFLFWPPKLKYIGIFNMGIDSIPNFPDSLVTFECWVNGYGFNAPSLPPLPIKLNLLTIKGAFFLTALPQLPPSLKHLEISSKQLGSLPALPNGLEYLGISGLLHNLPALPPGLKHLDCWVNLLDSLPILPNTLEYLNVEANPFLKQLPPLPNSLDTLKCGKDSSLTSLPPLPQGLKYLDLLGYSYYPPRGATNITCMPRLPDSLEILSFERNIIKCLPNMNNKIIAQYAGPDLSPLKLVRFQSIEYQRFSVLFL